MAGEEQLPVPSPAPSEPAATADQAAPVDTKPPHKSSVLESMFSRATLEFYSGPFPSPQMLRDYAASFPDVPERLMALVEEEAKLRRSIELKQVAAALEDQRADRLERRRGQWLGFGIGVIAIVAGAITASLGQPWPGGIIGSAGVVGLVSVFVLGRTYLAKPQDAE